MRFSFPGRTRAFPIPFLLAALPLLLVVAGSCSRPPRNNSAAARAGIEATSRELTQSFMARDAKAISLLYTEDGAMMPPNDQPVLGRDAIEKYWGALLALPVQSFRVETVEVFGSGDGNEATEEARYALVGPNGETVESGKALVIWRKTDAGWRLHRDMWSSNAPANAPAGPDSNGGMPSPPTPPGH